LADIDFTLGILFFLQAAVLFFAGLAIMLSYGPAAMAGPGALLMGLGIACGLATMVVLRALGIIFQARVCVYASTGVVPPSLDRDLTENAFRRKG
jgi:hypothetical protein